MAKHLLRRKNKKAHSKRRGKEAEGWGKVSHVGCFDFTELSGLTLRESSINGGKGGEVVVGAGELWK